MGCAGFKTRPGIKSSAFNFHLCHKSTIKEFCRNQWQKSSHLKRDYNLFLVLNFAPCYILGDWDLLVEPTMKGPLSFVEDEDEGSIKNIANAVQVTP